MQLATSSSRRRNCWALSHGRYRDPFALKSLLGRTTLQMTNHCGEADQQMDVVRADTTSIVDGIDTKLLEIIRRGWLKQQRGRREQPT